jgi:hypothetical protein
MISFKQFLKEGDLPHNVQKAWSTKAATEEQAVAWLIANNQEALASGKLIYRGFQDPPQEDMLFIDSSNSRRTSRDSSGMYQAMMDNSDAFKNVPSRSNSFICTTTESQTRRYGVSFVMFPKKGTPLAVSEVDDFFNSSISGEAMQCYGMGSIESMNLSIGRHLRDGFNIKPNRGMTATEIDDVLNNVKVEEFMKEMGLDKSKAAPAILAQIEKQGGKDYFTALANVIATPNNFGVEVVTYGTAKLDTNTELWFSGNALVVDSKHLSTLLQKLPPEIKVAPSIN